MFELTAARIRELEAKSRTGEFSSQAEAEEWFAAVDASKPRGEIVYEDGVPMGSTASEAEWDRWYTQPIADILFAKLAPRVHVPPRFDVAPRTEARPRGRRRRSARAGPARPDDDDPDLDLAALRTISPEAFSHVLKAAGL